MNSILMAKSTARGISAAALASFTSSSWRVTKRVAICTRLIFHPGEKCQTPPRQPKVVVRVCVTYFELKQI